MCSVPQQGHAYEREQDTAQGGQKLSAVGLNMGTGATRPEQTNVHRAAVRRLVRQGPLALQASRLHLSGIPTQLSVSSCSVANWELAYRQESPTLTKEVARRKAIPTNTFAPARASTATF